MALTRSISETVIARAACDPAFREALTMEAQALTPAELQRFAALWHEGEASGAAQPLDLAEVRRAARAVGERG